jgi:hypothetical protein
VCTQGGKIGNLEKVRGYLQEIFLHEVSQNALTLQGVLAYLPIIFYPPNILKDKKSFNL